MMAGLNVVPFIPLVLRGVRSADLDELSGEIAEQMRDYLAEPADRQRVARLCGLISFKLAPEIPAPERQEG